VGRRLALVALAKTHGRDVVQSGPVFESMKVEGGKLRVKFTRIAEGLRARTSPAPSAPNMAEDGYRFTLGSGPVTGFAVAGKDGRFHWADAAIDGDEVVVRADDVLKPVAVRYAWGDNPDCNLYNSAGLPAMPFRSDDW
jgi:sialate O-acetylesterase